MAGMRRTRRVFLNALTITSTLLALTVAASWVRSYLAIDIFCFYPPDNRSWIEVAASRGHAKFSDYQFGFYIYPKSFAARWAYFSQDADCVMEREHAFMGISWGTTKTYRWGEIVEAAVTIPHAYLLLLFAALPAIRIYRSIRRRRLMLAGHCRICGYDLRATPERCPECGAIPEKAKT
jgi:hypothetical protein